MSETRETAPEVPAEIVEQALNAYDVWSTGHIHRDMPHVLAAVYPAIEVMVLRAAAEDLRAKDCSGACEDGQPCEVDTGVRWLDARADRITREDQPHA